MPLEQRDTELAAIGASIGANWRLHIGTALAVGLELHQIKSALKMAGYVQQRAAAITADEVTRTLAEHTAPTAQVVSAT